MQSTRWTAAALAALLAPMSAHALSVDWQVDQAPVPRTGWPVAIAVIDVNRDGRDELITSTDYGGIQIWMRYADDWYPVDTPGLPTYEEFTKLVVVDLNHDGFQDIVGLRADGTPHAFHYHSGSGEWVHEQITDRMYTDIAVDDLDQDGRLEVLGVSPDMEGVDRYVFSREGWEWTKGVLQEGTFIRIAVGRFFGDAFRDFATVRSDGTLDTWKAISGGPQLEWVHVSVGLQLAPVSAVRPVDYDLDGLDELILVTHSGVNAIDFAGVWVNRSGQLGLLGQATDVAVGDLNRDGAPDLVGAGWNAHTFVWTPATGWRPTRFGMTGGWPCTHLVAILDFDGDGHADIACADGHQFLVWRHSGHADPLHNWLDLTSPGNQDPVNDVVGEDLNFDGRFDAAFGKEWGGLAISLAGSPAWMGGVWTNCPPPTALPLHRLESARLHPWDSYRDLVATTDDGVHVFRNDGACNWSEVAFYEGNFGALAVGDLDNDGFDEIAVATDGTVLLLRLVKEQLEPFGEKGLDSTINDLAIGDLNMDGWRDIVAATKSSVVKLMSRFGEYAEYPLYSEGGGYLRVAIGDIDGDGFPEVVAGGDGGDAVGVWVWFRSEEPYTFGEACSVPALALGDLTGDARREIAVHYGSPCSTTSSAIVVYTHQGTKLTSVIAPDPVRSLRIADLDRDGENDLLAATEGGVRAWGNKDSQAPIIQLHSFNPDSWNRTGPPILGAIVRDVGAGLDYSTRLCEYYNAATNAWTNCPSFTLSGQNGSTDEEYFSTAPLPLSAGAHQLRVRIADLAGNATDVVWNLKYDPTPPWNPSSFRIYLLPSPEARFDGATDHGGSGIVGYEAYLVPTPQATFSGTPNVFGEKRIDMAGMPEGPYYLAIKTLDNAGNWSAAKYMGPEYYDRTPPSTPSGFTSTPAKNTWVNSGDIMVRWAPSSDGAAGSGVARYYYRLDTSPGLTGGFSTTDTALPYPYSVNMLPEGKYWLNVTAQDNVGNRSAVGHHGFIGVDRTKPVALQLTAPLYGVWDQPFTVGWNVLDGLSGVAGVTVRIKKEERRGSPLVQGLALHHVLPNGSMTVTPTKMEHILRPPAYAYHFEIEATDNAGNTNKWTQIVREAPIFP